MIRVGSFAAAVISLAAACAVGPDYHRPSRALPSRYRFEPEATGTPPVADAPWWRVFHDDPLRKLIEEALHNNYDLTIAAARVEGARALAQAAGAQLGPTISATGTGNYGNSFQGLAAANKSFYAANGLGNLSWEIDLFGRLRRTAEAARAQYAASEEARRGVWVMVLADVGQNYFQLLALDIQRLIATRTVNDRAKTLDLFRVRANGGVGTDLDVARAEADLAGAKATLANLEGQIATTEDAISTLLGRSPGPIARTPAGTALTAPPVVPAGLPSSLLERRPDIREAEANVVAANAQVGVATANLFPQFSLTAAGGVVSTNLAFLPSPNPAAVHSAGGQASWLAPIFAGSALRYQLDASKANWTAAQTTYLKTILVALQEVSDVLVTLSQVRIQRTEQEKQVAALQRAVTVAQTQFEGGTASYLDVINAEQQRFAAELSLAQLEGAQLSTFVQLYRALGGGWWITE